MGGFHVFGGLLAGRGVRLVLKRGMLRYSFARSIYFTPDDPETFVAEVTKRLCTPPDLSASAADTDSLPGAESAESFRDSMT